MNSKLKALIIIVAVFLGMQLIVPSKTNPAVDKTKEITAPENVKTVLKKACYDCHSNETKWPWYTSVAPFSWIAATHVAEGRAWVNFSEWENYEEANKTKLKKLIFRAASHAMPPHTYKLMHKEAELTAEEKKLIRDWTGVNPEDISARE